MPRGLAQVLWLLLATAATACASRAGEPAIGQPGPGPGAASQAAPPAPYPVAPTPLGGFSQLLGALDGDLPCPLPGLPPEITARIDCSAMRRATSAVAYSPRAVVASALPPAVDLRARGLAGPTKDQGQVGACSGFAMSTVLDNAVRRSGRGDVIAPMHVFATYTGASLDRVVGRPMTVEPVLPYDGATACRFSKSADQSSSCGSYYRVTPGSAYGDPGLLAARARADQSGVVRVDALEYMDAPFDFDQLAALLADGEAVWLSMRWHVAILSDPANTRSGYLPWYPPESTDSLHAVTLEGYRWGRYGREFLVHNSWGESFGDHGWVWVPESMMRTHLSFAYRVRSSLGGVPMIGAPASPGQGGLCLPGFGCLPAPSSAGGAAPRGLPAGLGMPSGLGLPASLGLPATLPSGLPL